MNPLDSAFVKNKGTKKLNEKSFESLYAEPNIMNGGSNNFYLSSHNTNSQ